MKIRASTIRKILIAAALVYLVVNPNSRRLIRQEIGRRKMLDNISRLEKENERLADEIKLLETNDAYYSATVRRELGMLKPGEVEYRFGPGGRLKSYAHGSVVSAPVGKKSAK